MRWSPHSGSPGGRYQPSCSETTSAMSWCPCALGWSPSAASRAVSPLDVWDLKGVYRSAYRPTVSALCWQMMGVHRSHPHHGYAATMPPAHSSTLSRSCWRVAAAAPPRVCQHLSALRRRPSAPRRSRHRRCGSSTGTCEAVFFAKQDKALAALWRQAVLSTAEPGDGTQHIIGATHRRTGISPQNATGCGHRSMRRRRNTPRLRTCCPRPDNLRGDDND